MKACNQEIAKFLTAKIFQLGDDIGENCHRIAFVCGEYPDNETFDGGLNKEALERFILDCLEEENGY